MTIRVLSTVSIAAITGILLAQPGFSQSEQKLGSVNFETSCKPEAARLFDQAMLYQHSFWYRASQKLFDDALTADPECAIAHWGIALSLLLNPHVPPPPENLVKGAAAIADARAFLSNR